MRCFKCGINKEENQQFHYLVPEQIGIRNFYFYLCQGCFNKSIELAESKKLDAAKEFKAAHVN